MRSRTRGPADGTDRALRVAAAGPAGAGAPALSGPARAAHLRAGVRPGLAAVAAPPDHAHQRVPAFGHRAESAQVPRSRDGEVPVRRRRGRETRGLHPAGLIALDRHEAGHAEIPPVIGPLLLDLEARLRGELAEAL